METILIILLVIVVVVAVWFIGIYNGLVKLRVRTNEAWSDIDVQLKRRYDLIPNLISTVKGYATHEKKLFENVTEARANAMNAQNPEEKAGAENMLSDTLKSLFAVSENYPDLKANTNFLELQRELSDTENKIQASRRFYNGNVRDLNTKIQIFPDSIVAGILNIQKREFFEIDEPKEKETPKVEF
ncbi:MAG: LemA family protein [Candidatus Pacebacteria bacterium]|nr:LemA family protein [Candidatus Paceibacterota bacterium]